MLRFIAFKSCCPKQHFRDIEKILVKVGMKYIYTVANPFKH